MDDATRSETVQELDTLTAAVSDAPPSDVLQIVASLDADLAEPSPPLAPEPAEEAEAPAQDAEGPIEAGAQDAQEAAEAGTIVDEDASRALEPEPVAAIRGDVDLPEVAESAGHNQSSVPTWPFVAYVGVWIAAAAAAGWFLSQTAAGAPVSGSPIYATTVFAGLGLASAGPLLALVVWIASSLRARGTSHKGLFVGALLRGAVATLCGVALWWAMLLIVDTLRLGRPI